MGAWQKYDRDTNSEQSSICSILIKNVLASFGYQKAEIINCVSCSNVGRERKQFRNQYNVREINALERNRLKCKLPH